MATREVTYKQAREHLIERGEIPSYRDIVGKNPNQSLSVKVDGSRQGQFPQANKIVSPTGTTTPEPKRERYVRAPFAKPDDPFQPRDEDIIYSDAMMRERRNARISSIYQELDEKARKAARKKNPMLSDSDTEADEEETSSLNKSTASNFTDDPPYLYSEATEAEKSLQDPTSYHHEDKIDPTNSDEKTQESYDTSFLSQRINSDSTRENTDHDHLIPNTCPTVVQSHDPSKTKPPDHRLVVKPKESTTGSGKQNETKHPEKHEKLHKPNIGFGAKNWSPTDKKKKKKKHSKNHNG